MKAVFIDFMGTIVSDQSSYLKEVVMRCYKNGAAKSPEEIMAFWMPVHEKLLEHSYGDQFELEYNIAINVFLQVMEKFHIKDNAEELCAILEKHWVYSKPFEDTREFFDKCPCPIYIVSNNDTRYLEEAVDYLKLHPAGIITSQMCRAYKPRKEIFELALKRSGCTRDEVIHVGDSLRSDVEGAKSAGITPWLLDRRNQYNNMDIIRMENLSQVLEKL